MQGQSKVTVLVFLIESWLLEVMLYKVVLSIWDVKNLKNFIIIGSSQTEPYKDKKKIFVS